jgi:drug/metabolite transporter (DMT)-like permease
VDLRRLRAGEWLAGVAGIALIVTLLLPWYEAPAGTVTGYEALSVIDILLTLLALLALALPVLQATQDGPSRPVGAAVLTVVLGGLGVLLVLFRLIDAPADGLEVRPGAWAALVAVVAIVAGGWRSLAAEYVRGLPPDLEPELRATPAP